MAIGCQTKLQISDLLDEQNFMVGDASASFKKI